MAFEVAVKSWVAHKISRVRRRRDKQALEATKLKPIALAGASNGFSGRSQLCNSFARTQTRILRYEAHIEVTKADGGPQAEASHGFASSGIAPLRRDVSHQDGLGQWKPCAMCSRHVLRQDSKRFAEFCSLDCKTAAYLDVKAAGCDG
uniref:FLZ-type domain-containing protein n=1 Tax=Globisporangium ultimum (strain ATCC 200006 / CBS 805.95 / DAOM BR144) TaxID=431595 RepID=K3WF88_GLOUD